MAMYLKYTSFIKIKLNPSLPCISRYMLNFTYRTLVICYEVNKSFHHLKNVYWSLDEFKCINEITFKRERERERGGGWENS